MTTPNCKVDKEVCLQQRFSGMPELQSHLKGVPLPRLLNSTSGVPSFITHSWGPRIQVSQVILGSDLELTKTQVTRFICEGFFFN